VREIYRKGLMHYVHGLLMGSADIVPGVSGGTVALIVGIYERLISSVRALASSAVAVLRLDGERFRGRLREVHWRLIIPLGLGIGTALVIGARFIPHLMETYPVQARALFFGLIAGSLLIPWRRIRHRVPGHYLAAVAATVLAFLIVGFPPREIVSPALWMVFGAASVAICAMILPGVSGSFLLLVMGMYEPTLRAVNGRDLLYIAVFGMGAVIGLGLFSRVLEFLLERYHDLTMAALVGLMAGSLRALWPYQDMDRSLLAPPADTTVLVPLALGLAGFVFVTILTYMGATADRKADTAH